MLQLDAVLWRIVLSLRVTVAQNFFAKRKKPHLAAGRLGD
jgi:hypothetical protein